jgi:hypothetical protein
MSAEAVSMNVRSCERPKALALAALLAAFFGVPGCGVEEHVQGGATPINTAGDLGPIGPPTTGAGGMVALGSGGVPGGGGIVPPPAAGGVPPVAAGGISNGGIPPSSGGVPPMGAGGFVPGAGGVTPVGSGGVPPGTGGAPLSGATITLGTTNVPAENAIAFIHFGHSNMAGRATGPTATRPYFFTETDPRAWMYHAGSPPALAHEPLTANDDTSGTYGGPGTAIVKEAAALAPSKYFISLGFGKTSAYCSQFLPGALYYDTLIKAALSAKGRVTFGAIIIMLGITERHGTSADITGYSACINKLVTQIRTDVGRPDLPLLITDYEQEATGMLAVNQAFAQSIIPEIRKIPTVVSNSALVPTDMLGMQDDHHFNLDGHKEWVRRLLQIMKDRGWFPWN